MRCPVLSYRPFITPPIALRLCYVLSGTACDAPIVLRLCYALSGTESSYAATRPGLAESS
eukprot:3263502-Rhodomonas_salina.1